MYDLKDYRMIVSLLPSEMVKSSDLKRGDFIMEKYTQGLVIESVIQPEYHNDGNNQRIVFLGYSSAYRKPSDEVKIIKRGLLDEVKFQEYIAERLKEEEESERLAEEEEKEDRAREREALEDRLRELKDK